MHDNHRQHDLGNTLTIISGYTHLLQRMTHRTTDLTDRERSEMLETHETLLTAVERLGVQIEGLTSAAQELPPPSSTEPS